MNIPTVNIESFGVKTTHNDANGAIYEKYYVASFNFEMTNNVTFLNATLFSFGHYTKTVYLPILFKKEKHLQELLQEWENLGFRLSYGYEFGEETAVSSYHISEIIDIKELFNTHISKYLNNHKKEYWKIVPIIKYKDYEIRLSSKSEKGPDALSYVYNSFIIDPSDLISINKNKNCIDFFIANYDKIPVADRYYIRVEHGFADICSSIANAKKWVDTRVAEIQAENDIIDSMYSKKTFKLVAE